MREALAIVRREPIDVVVLDTSRGRASSRGRQLLEICPALKIVAFGVGTVDDALACAEAGVRAFVGENGSVDEIGEAVRRRTGPGDLPARTDPRACSIAWPRSPAATEFAGTTG